MPTSQKVQIDTYDFGASLTAPTLGALSTGTTITDGTASTCNEQTADSGVYIADFVGADASHLIPAGTYRLRTAVNGKPLKRFVTFTGVDGELVYARAERAAVLDSASVTAVQNGLATQSNVNNVGTAVLTVGTLIGTPSVSVSADVASIKSDTSSLISRLTANAATAIQNLFHMLTGTGTSSKYTVAALENAPSGGGGGGTTTIVTLQAAAGISPGVIVGPSEPLVIGDDYLTVMNRSVRINLLDANGDPAEVEYGTYALDDAGISIQMLLAKSGKPSVEALIVGTCTFFSAVGDVPPYLIVEFTKVETAKAIPGPYDMQVEAVWNDGKTVTFAPYGQIEFTRNIGRRT